MPKNLTKVYDLKEDTGLIYTYQSYTREGGCGFVPEHGLFGSEEWWEAIKIGALPSHTLEGPILRADTLQTSGMLEQDYLELEIADPDSPGLLLESLRRSNGPVAIRCGTASQALVCPSTPPIDAVFRT